MVHLDLSIMLVDHLLKSKKEYKNLKKTGDAKFSDQNKLDETCFQHDLAYSGSKHLPRRTSSNKALRNKAFDIAKNPKHAAYQCGRVSIVYKFVTKSLLHMQMQICYSWCRQK